MANKTKVLNEKQKVSFAKKINKATVSLRMKSVFRSKYGLLDGVWKSNEKVGKRFGISGEAVRLILIKVHNLFEDESL